MKIVKEKLALLAILTSLSVVLAIFFIIPVPMTKGYVNLLEVGIYTTAMLLGGPAGAIVGAVSGGMLDLILGYPQWMPFSIVIHGAQGYIAGRWSLEASWAKRLLFLTLASIVMVIGYYMATSLLYGQVAGVASIPGNILQTVFGVGVAIVVTKTLEKTNIFK